MDQGDGRLGLAYSRKTDEAGDFEARLLGNFKHALQACALLEREEKLTSRITFRTDEAVVVFNDRLVAANNGDVLQQVQPQLARALGRIWNAPLTIEAVSPNSPERLSFRMRAPHAQSVDALLARL
jgi:hypothetical protein